MKKRAESAEMIPPEYYAAADAMTDEILANDFSQDAKGWTPGQGSWSVSDGKYKNSTHEVNVSLSDEQYAALKGKSDLSHNEFADLYAEFQKVQPTKHLMQVLEAFRASGGNAEVEPVYDEETQRLNVSLNFVIKDKKLERIEGLTPIEDIVLKMDAMLQVESVLADLGPDDSPPF